jgi:hypothetical protein
VWFKYTPATTSRHLLSTAVNEGTASTVDDTVLAIYTSAGGDAGPFTMVPTAGAFDGCDDDSASVEDFQSTLVSELTGGTTYYIVVWKFSSTAPTVGNTAVQLTVKDAIAPPSDNAANIQDLDVRVPVRVDTLAASDDYELAPASPCFAGNGTADIAAGKDVVYRFTAPTAGAYHFRARGAGGANVVIYLAASLPPGFAPQNVNCTTAANRSTATGAGAAEDVRSVLAAGEQVFVIADATAAAPSAAIVVEAFAEPGAESEPNGTPATAGTAACGTYGAINPATEVDFFSLGTPAGGSRVFAMVESAAASNTDADLRVTNATDTLEYDDANNDVLFGSLGPNVAGTPLANAASFLRVSGFSASTVSDPYRLFSVVQSATPAAEAEPNETTVQASAAGTNYFAGQLSGAAPSTDTDVYSFHAEKGQLIFLGLDADPARDNTPINARLDLIAPDGTVLDAINDPGSTSSTAPGAGTLTATAPSAPSEGLVEHAPVSGTYFARVAIGTSSMTATGAGDYLLSVSLSCTTGAAPAIAQTSLPAGQVGVPYGAGLTATNAVGATTFTLASGALPPGIALSPSGALSGTPTTQGSFPLTVRLTDGRGLVSERALTIAIAAPSGATPPPPPPPAAPRRDTTNPVVTLFRSVNARFAVAPRKGSRVKKGTRFTFRLSEAGQARITIAARLSGRRVGGKCVSRTRANRARPRCTRFVTKGTIAFAARAGANSRAFSGKLRGRALPAGVYRATIVVTDAAGNRSAARTATLRIVRG